MKKYTYYFVIVLISVFFVTTSCKKDSVQTPEDYVKDLPKDVNVQGFWMGYVYGKVIVVAGKKKLTITDTSTIHNGISEFHQSGADFSYQLKKENGDYIHEYDPSSKTSMNYWYTGKSGNEQLVYDVYANPNAAPSTRIDFDYRVFNTDTLVTTDYASGETRILVRLSDPMHIPDSLKIQK